MGIFNIQAIVWLIILSVINSGNAQTFSGKLDNLNNTELVILTLQDDVYSRRDTVYTDNQGNFSIELHLKRPGYIRLWGSNFRNEDIYLQPHADLHIAADCLNGSSFWATQRFTGLAALYNNFRADLYRNELMRVNGFDAKTYELSQDEFVQHINRYYALRDSVKNVYFAGLPYTEDLRDFLLVDSVHAAYEQSSVFRSYVQFLPKGKQDVFYATYIEPYAKNQSDDWRHLASSNYRWFFATFVKKQFDDENSERKAQGLEPLPYYYEQAPFLIEKFVNNGALRKYVAETLLESISFEYASLHDSLLDVYDQYIAALYHILDTEIRANSYHQRFSAIRDFRDQIAVGKQAFAFEVLDTLGNRVSLADLRGKLLYIDLWASWCGPCIGEFPAARELEVEYEDEDRLVFLSVSFDDLEQDWHRGMQQHKPVGEQYWAQGGFKSDFATQYQIDGIPHYLLIDGDGNFVSYKAPRPSSKEIRDMLANALAEMEREGDEN